jgi:hypothetical protein
MSEEELYHYGIKGQKWGVRRYQNKDGSLTDAGKKRYDDGPPQSKKERKALKKAQKEWDKNFEKNYVDAYNKAVEKTDKLIADLNKKYDKYDFTDLSDPDIKKTYDKYVDEYMREWNKLLQASYDEMFGKRPGSDR